MKKKIFLMFIVVILILLGVCNVKAYSGEIDPKNYVTMPDKINVENGKGTGTITLSESASDFSIAYQKIDISSSTFNSILEAIESGQNVLDLIPDFTGAWTTTNKSTNNVNIDFSTYTEGSVVNFVIWAKIQNSTETYYDLDVYSSQINMNGSGTQNGSWANATIKVEKSQEVRKYNFTVSNVTPEKNHTYYYFIGNNSTTPQFSTNLPQLQYDEEKGVLYSSSNISNYLELAADQYVYIYDYYLDDSSTFVNKIVLNKAKLNKPEQKKYTDVFYATMISKLTDSSNCETQILFDTPWGDETIRKIHLKIGKISDDNILKNIYNKKANSFEELLQYAKKTNAFYDKTLDSDNPKLSTAGGIKLSEPNALFDANNITNGEYYFLYAVVEDENGTYVKTEGVTFARASKSSSAKNSFSLFFYGSDDFTWKTFSSEVTENGKDPTVANKALPYAGMINIIIVISIVAILVIGIVFLNKYRKYNF